MIYSWAGAQIPEYEMDNQTVSDCDGILFDSGGTGDYNNNEDLTFTIDAGNPLSLTFIGDFCLDNGFDFLTIHDGPDTNSPVLAGPFTGNENPGSFFVPAGIVTIHFVSDHSAVFCGFEMEWDAQAPQPDPPEMNILEAPTCGSNIFSVTFTEPVACASVNAANFQLTGANDIIVNNAISLDCNEDFATEVLLLVGETFNYNCQYSLLADVQVADECDSLWTFSVDMDFLVDDCNINASISAESDTICSGTCTQLEVIHPNCLTYEYEWNEGLPPTDGPHEVCPLSTTTYTVEITEVETGQVEVFEYTLEVNNAEIDFEDQSICQSLPGFQLSGFPENGEWEGPGLSEETPGFFEPDSADIGSNIITYWVSETCSDSIEIDIIESDAGPVQAACPDSNPFGFSPSPSGGEWSGPHIVADSLFNPSETGSFVVYYDALNGCTDSTTVNVADISGEFDLDTICQSNFTDTLSFAPFGGYWEGPGIVDSLLGIYEPAMMPDGEVQLTYYINGCEEEAEVFVKPIYTGPAYVTACPENAAFEIIDNEIPSGGVWEGPFLTDTIDGVYDPALPGNNVWSENIYSALNGCTDTVFVWNIETVIEPDTIYFCENDDPLPLVPETIGRQPWGGNWTGGVVYNSPEEYFEFDPGQVPIGTQTLHYEVNECTDSLVVVVGPNELPVDTLMLCSNEPPFELVPSMQEGGAWSGQGIANQHTGMYDPAQGTPGGSYLHWQTPGGCRDSVFVYLQIFQEGAITELDSTYCLQDSTFSFSVTPVGGDISGPVSDTLFNPMETGSGDFTIVLSFEDNACSSTDSFEVTVLPQLEANLTASESVLCNGESVTLSAEAAGGQSENSLSYSWNQGLPAISQNTASPDEATTYIVTVSDNCSDPVSDSVMVEVLPPINVTVSLSDTLCFGDSTGTASIESVNLAAYSSTWGENPPLEAQSIMADAGSSHLLTITDLAEGCTFDTLISIPSYTPISANFSINPNEDCIPFDAADPLNIIDLSQNAVSGIWDFGNGQSEMYQPGENPVAGYEVPGNYTLELFVQNEGGCIDSTEKSICVANPTPIFIPDIFSPNGDGHNDMLYVRGPAIETMSFMVFDRWGTLVFSSTDPNHGWDGNSGGTKMPEGVYVYQLTAKLEDGGTEKLKGNVTLIR